LVPLAWSVTSTTRVISGAAPVMATSIPCVRVTGAMAQNELRARAVVVATGASYRRLPVVDLEAYEGSSVFYAASQPEALRCAGSEVAVVGGGNSAGQAALFLAARVAHVHLLVRRASLDSSMSRYLSDQVTAHERITVHPSTQISGIRRGTTGIDAIQVTRNYHAVELPVRAIFVFIGARANTDWLVGTLALDVNGFVLTGDAAGAPSWLEASAPAVFAVGATPSDDAASRRCPPRTSRCRSRVAGGAYPPPGEHRLGAPLLSPVACRGGFLALGAGRLRRRGPAHLP
jgi:thioredoxin reductase